MAKAPANATRSLGCATAVLIVHPSSLTSYPQGVDQASQQVPEGVGDLRLPHHGPRVAMLSYSLGAHPFRTEPRRSKAVLALRVAVAPGVRYSPHGVGAGHKGATVEAAPHGRQHNPAA